MKTEKTEHVYPRECSNALKVINEYQYNFILGVNSEVCQENLILICTGPKPYFMSSSYENIIFSKWLMIQETDM
jgi:hypothetical protein